MNRTPETAPFDPWHGKELSPDDGVSIKGAGFKLDKAADASSLVSMIREQKQLRYLELEGNTLGIEAAKEIGKALESKPELVAALWKDLFTGRMKTEIPHALQNLLAGVDLAGARLTCLDLSDNAIGPVGMPGLVPYFRSSNSYSIKELIFNNNGWGPTGGCMLADALINCFRQSVEAGGEVFQLRTFICGRSRIEDEAGIALSKFFKEIKSLETVHMPQNGIRVGGIGALADAFKENRNLKSLNLNDNTVTPAGCVKLAECLRSLPHLQELNLGDCLLKTEGVRTLCPALAECKNLEIVNMESNEIEDDGGIELANVLSKLPKLKQVILSSNEFSNRAVDDIARIFPRGVEVSVDSEEGDENEWRSAQEPGEGESAENSAVEDAEVLNFVRTPTQENFEKLMPDPATRISDYLDQAVSNGTPASLTCVRLAFTVSEFASAAAADTVQTLLEKAMTDRFFSTYVLSRLGMMQLDEEGMRGFDVSKISPKILNALSAFIKTHRLSNATLASFLFFIQKQAPTAKENSQHVNSLLQVVDNKLHN